ncbi:MAG TPA: class II aldolase/adducin family protein [Firmicutes bacterium]|nr:class II aldolase/adducin family protein [Bacillota bacterium]
MLNFKQYEGLPKNASEAIEQCVLANRILANEGVLDGFGHVSVRNPENSKTFFQARSIAPEFVNKEDILEIDLEGNIVTNTNFRAYGERIIHASIYKYRTDVQAVFHGHPTEIIALSCLNIPIRSVAQYCGMFYEPLPFYDDYEPGCGMLIVTQKEGDRVARTLGNALGLVMRGHGCTVVGANVQQMVMNAIFLRDNAKIQYLALALGEPKYLSEQEGRETTKAQYSENSLGRCWNYWVARAKKAMPDLNF